VLNYITKLCNQNTNAKFLNRSLWDLLKPSEAKHFVQTS